MWERVHRCVVTDAGGRAEETRVCAAWLSACVVERARISDNSAESMVLPAAAEGCFSPQNEIRQHQR